ncbi:MAG: glycosyltransferase family 2 protein [Deltaproteobacteria bacterium]|nr:glycosyltransferase family 2 protein [Deltaproteobacteria bacterium]
MSGTYLTVVIPCWDEAGTLEAFVRSLTEVLDAEGFPYDLLVVDDGSTDGSEAIADRLAAELGPVRVVHHPVNQGLGGVYRTGFREARGEFVTFMAADMQFPAWTLRHFLPHLPDHDMVLGYLPDRRDSALGKLLSLGERALIRLLFGGFPRFQGTVVFRRELLSRVPLVSEGRGWGIFMELILRSHRAGARLVSVPSVVEPRRLGRSKAGTLRNVRANLEQLLALRRALWREALGRRGARP